VTVITKLHRATNQTQLRYLAQNTFAEVTGKRQELCQGTIVFRVLDVCGEPTYYAIGTGQMHLLKLSPDEGVLQTIVSVLTPGDVITLEIRS